MVLIMHILLAFERGTGNFGMERQAHLCEAAKAKDWIDALRKRANAAPRASYSLGDVLDERARELYCEGFRRTDLIRYNQFGGAQATYNWEYKGGNEKGTTFDKKFNVYPLPSSEILANPNLNPEYILSRSEWNTREIEMFNTPCGFSGNVNSTGRVNPTQNLVDSYETINGLPIDQDPSYNDQDPYKNRDPRLEQTIFHQGSIWGDKSQDEERAVDVSVGGKDYQDLHGGTTTGYYSKKFVHNMSFKNPTTYVTACPIFRYAEILLNAAEALNEAKGPEAAYDYVNQVRARVGMPAYKGMTKEQLRERIRNERRIELAFEDHRFFDERRWKLFDGKSAATEKSEPRYKQVYNIYSVVVTPNESQVYTYRNDNIHPTRAFSCPKNYYFPVPDDTYKKNPNLGQNAGWELSDAPKKDDTTEGGETTEGETTGK